MTMTTTKEEATPADDVEVMIPIQLTRSGWRAVSAAISSEIFQREHGSLWHADAAAKRERPRLAALRAFIAQITFVALTLALLASPARAAESIVVIVADDLRTQDLAFMPELTALAARGAGFSSALAYPLCTPSRVSLLTGEAPDRHGILTNDVRLFDRNTPTLGTRLQAAGWRTAMFGKWMNKMARLPEEERRFPGWDRWLGLVKHSDYGRDQTRVLGNRTTDFLRDCEAAGVPCFAYVAPAAPHGPNFGPEDCDATIPPIEGEWEPHRWSQRLSSICGLDRMIGKIARRAPTWLIVVGDNGYMAENGRAGKNELVIDAVRVPLVVVGPNVGAGRDRREIVSLMDVHATVLDLAGIAPSAADGQTLSPLLPEPVAGVSPPAWSGTLLLMSEAPSPGDDDEE